MMTILILRHDGFELYREQWNNIAVHQPTGEPSVQICGTHIAYLENTVQDFFTRSESKLFAVAKPQIEPQHKNPFKTGDVVLLNSGSPNLTVDSVVGNDVNVSWMDGAEKRVSRFPFACLHRVDDAH